MRRIHHLALLFAVLPATAVSSATAGLFGASDERRMESHQLDVERRAGLYFEENRGQTDERVRFLARCRGYMAFLTDHEVVFAADEDVVRMRFVGSDERAMPVAEATAPGRTNYFIGEDESRWVTGVRHYASVRVPNVYPGIDVRWSGTSDRCLRYDLVVAPGIDPESIRFELTGAESIRLSEGVLVAETRDGRLQHSAPVLFQEVGGRRRCVRGAFVLLDERTVAFRVGAYDRTLPLVIDPTLTYSTYHGGSSTDIGLEIAIDGKGAAYVAGSTDSTDFPTKSAAQGSAKSGRNAFVTKIDANGSTLVYSTYLGGNGADIAHGVAVDGSGAAYAAGSTTSSDYPLKSARQTTSGGGDDGFVTKLDSSGVLAYSTYHGGSAKDRCAAIAVDGSGRAYVVGETASTNLPTKSPLQSTNAGGVSDAFVAAFDANGSGLVYSTYLGGSSEDGFHMRGLGIAVESGGAAYVTGATSSSDFPTKSAYQTKLGGGFDVFVAKLKADGSALVYSTFLGGSGTDQATGIAVDGSGNAYVAGATGSTNFPTSSPVQSSHGGGSIDGFVTKLSASGAALSYSTYLGGNGAEGIFTGSLRGEIAVSASGAAYVAGWTTSSDFPTKEAYQATHGGGSEDAFVTMVSAAGSKLVYSTYLGGTGDDRGHGIAVDGSGNAYIAGRTGSSDFPTKGPVQTTHGGGSYDAFVSKLPPPGPPEAPTGLAADAQSDAEILLSWVDADGRAAKFDLERSVAGGTFVPLEEIENAATSHADDTVAGETAYAYRVRAVNDLGESAYSQTVAVVSPPHTPADLVATPLSNTRVDLTWTDASQAESTYEIERRLDAPGEEFLALATLGQDATGNADTTVLPESSYTYRVRAVNSNGTSRWLQSAPVTTAPRDPTEAATVSVADTSVRISWRDLSDVESGYEIQRGTGCPGRDFVQVGIVPADMTTFMDLSTRPETTYAYRVRAVSESGASEWAPEICVRTAPFAPTEPAGETLSPSRVRIAWADNSNVEQGFEIWRLRSGDRGGYQLLDTLPANTTEYLDTTTLQESRYAYRVTAFDANGTSNPASVSDLDTPALLAVKAVKLKPAKGKKPAQMIVVGEFDIGELNVGLSAAATLEVNGRAVAIPGFEPKGRKLRYADDELLLDLKPPKAGSRVAFKLKAKGAIVPTDPDGEITFRFTSGLFDAMGTVSVKANKFVPKKGLGTWVDPAFYVTSIRAKLTAGPKDSLTIKASFAPGDMPDVPSDIEIEFGPVLEFTAKGSEFKASGSKLVFEQKLLGTRRITLDYAKGIATFALKGVELGTFTEDEVPLRLRISSDTIHFEDTPVLTGNGKSLKY